MQNKCETLHMTREKILFLTIHLVAQLVGWWLFTAVEDSGYSLQAINSFML